MTAADDGQQAAGTGEAAPVAAPRAPMPASPPAAVTRGTGRPSRFVASVVGHLAFGALVVAGVVAYQNLPRLLGSMADTVCDDQLLGQYRSAPGTTVASRTPPLAARETPARAVDSQPAAPDRSAAPSSRQEPVTPANAASAASVAADTASGTTPPAADGGAKRDGSIDAGGKPATIPAPAAAPADAKASFSNEREPWALPAPTAVKPVASVPQPGATASTTAAATKPAPATPPVPSRAAAASPPTERPGARAPAVSSAGAQDRLAARWQSARSAYHSGKPEAIASYRALVADYPEVPDLPGELGNIYYSAGWINDAAEQYYEAAQRYLRAGQPGAAACLVDVLKRLNSRLADTLSETVTAPCPTASKDTAAGGRSG